jgi:transposase
MKPNDNMITNYPPEMVAQFMATMEQQRPSRRNAPIAHVNAPASVAPTKAVQEPTEERMAAIAAFYAEGNSYKETAKIFRVSLRTAMRAVKENGGVSRSPARKERITDEAARAVYARYVQGELLYKIAAETGVAYTTYKTRWARLGLPFPANASRSKSG